MRLSSHTVPLLCAAVPLLLQLLLLLASWAHSHSELAVNDVTAMQFGANLIQS